MKITIFISSKCLKLKLWLIYDEKNLKNFFINFNIIKYIKNNFFVSLFLLTHHFELLHLKFKKKNYRIWIRF